MDRLRLDYLRCIENAAEFVAVDRLAIVLITVVGLLMPPLTGCAGGNGNDETHVVIPPKRDATSSPSSLSGRQTVDGGPAEEFVFPRHFAPMETDRGGQYFAGKLVLDHGCLRFEAPPYDPTNPSRPPLLIWPSAFRINTEGGTVRIVDALGRVAAHVGDHVRLTIATVPYHQAQDDDLIQGLSVRCPGPYMLAGDEVMAFDPDKEPIELYLADPEVIFLRQKTVVSSLQELLLAGIVGELVLDGPCLRIKSDGGGLTSVKWPPGFTPHVHQGVVQVRNGAGRVIAEVGDRITGGGGFSNSGYGGCPGSTIGINSITILPDVEVYFPQQDGTLTTNNGMDRFVGHLIVDKRCLRADSVVRDRDRALFPSEQPLLIWPHTFTLSVENDVVQIANETGRIVARAGDEIQFSAGSVSYSEAIEHSGLQEITGACSGPYWVVGDDFTAVPNVESP